MIRATKAEKLAREIARVVVFLVCISLMPLVATSCGGITGFYISRKEPVENPEGTNITSLELGAMYGFHEVVMRPDGEFAVASAATGAEGTDNYEFALLLVSIREKTCQRIAQDHRDCWYPRWSVDDKQVIFVSGNSGSRQIWTVDIETGEQRQITNIEGGVWGSIHSDLGGSKVAFLSAGKEPPPDHVIEANSVRGLSISPSRSYPLKWWVLDVLKESLEPVASGEQYSDSFAWAPDSESYAIAELSYNNTSNEVEYKLVLRDLETCEKKVLTDSIGWIGGMSFSPNGEQVAACMGKMTKLTGKKTIFKEPWIIDIEGGEVKPALDGHRLSVSTRCEDEPPLWGHSGEKIYCCFNMPEASVVSEVSLKDKRAKHLTPQDACASAFALGTRSWGGKTTFIMSEPTKPQEIYVLEDLYEKQPRMEQVTSHNEALVEGKRAYPCQRFYFKRSGHPVSGLIYLPRPYGNKDKMFAVVRVHGGPTSQFSRYYDFFTQELCDRGYVVILVNPRGSTGRSWEYQELVDLGNEDLEDVVASVQAITEIVNINRDRIAILGVSYGGFLSAVASYKAGDTFSAAVVISGISDLTSDTLTTGSSSIERIAGTEPWQDNTPYWENSPVAHADDIYMPVLVIHGQKDSAVSWQQANELAYSIWRTGGKCDLVIYPEGGHGDFLPLWNSLRAKPMITAVASHKILEWLDREIGGLSNRNETTE